MITNNILSFEQGASLYSIAPTTKPKEVNSFSDVMNTIDKPNKSSVENIAGQNSEITSEKFTLSQEAMALNRSTKIEYNPAVIFQNANKNGGVFFEPVKPLESILSENLALLDNLKNRTPKTMHEKYEIDSNIRTLMSYGDKEYYPDESALSKKKQAHFDAFAIYLQDIAENPEKYPHIRNLNSESNLQSFVASYKADMNSETNVKSVDINEISTALSEPKYMYDPIAIYLGENTHGMVIYEHSTKSILPENLALLDLLKNDHTTGSRLHRDEAISIIMRYGDKEVFSDIESIEAKRSDTLVLLKQTVVDMEKNPEKYPHLTMFEEGDRSKVLKQKMGVLINHYRELAGLTSADEYKGLTVSSATMTSFDSKKIMEEYQRKMSEYQDTMTQRLFA